jgi:hypothetical protein
MIEIINKQNWIHVKNKNLKIIIRKKLSIVWVISDLVYAAIKKKLNLSH